jgi:Homeodomain-like domain
MSQLYAAEAVMGKKRIVQNKISTKGTTRKPIGKRKRRPRTRVIEREVIVKRYVVRLSREERERLDAMVHKGKGSAWNLLKARILLKADVSDAGEAWSDSRIVEALNTNPSMVYLVRKQLVEEGFDAVLTRKKRDMPPVPKIFDGEKEAKLIALTCSKPPAGYARWSLRLLEDKVVELEIVDAASDNTIGRVLKKTFLSPIAKNSGSFRPKRMPRL